MCNGVICSLESQSRDRSKTISGYMCFSLFVRGALFSFEFIVKSGDTVAWSYFSVIESS